MKPIRWPRLRARSAPCFGPNFILDITNKATTPFPRRELPAFATSNRHDGPLIGAATSREPPAMRIYFISCCFSRRPRSSIYNIAQSMPLGSADFSTFAADFISDGAIPSCAIFCCRIRPRFRFHARHQASAARFTTFSFFHASERWRFTTFISLALRDRAISRRFRRNLLKRQILRLSSGLFTMQKYRYFIMPHVSLDFGLLLDILMVNSAFHASD